MACSTLSSSLTVDRPHRLALQAVKRGRYDRAQHSRGVPAVVAENEVIAASSLLNLSPTARSHLLPPKPPRTSERPFFHIQGDFAFRIQLSRFLRPLNIHHDTSTKCDHETLRRAGLCPRWHRGWILDGGCRPLWKIAVPSRSCLPGLPKREGLWRCWRWRFAWPDPAISSLADVSAVTDDTIAINAAISSGGRCDPGVCKGATIAPATVYFPSGYVKSCC